jgi:IS5 family transposase
MRTRGGVPWTIGTGTWGGPKALARLETHNDAPQRVRCRFEKVVGTCKRSYGLRRMRWFGLAKGRIPGPPAAIAYTLRRMLALLHPAAA